MAGCSADAINQHTTFRSTEQEQGASGHGRGAAAEGSAQTCVIAAVGEADFARSRAKVAHVRGHVEAADVTGSDVHVAFRLPDRVKAALPGDHGVVLRDRIARVLPLVIARAII